MAAIAADRSDRDVRRAKDAVAAVVVPRAIPRGAATAASPSWCPRRNCPEGARDRRVVVHRTRIKVGLLPAGWPPSPAGR